MEGEQAAERMYRKADDVYPTENALPQSTDNKCPLPGTVQLKLWQHISSHTLQGEKDLEDHLTSSTDESKFSWKRVLLCFGFVPSITALTMSPFLTIKAGQLQAWKYLLLQ